MVDGIEREERVERQACDAGSQSGKLRAAPTLETRHRGESEASCAVEVEGLVPVGRSRLRQDVRIDHGTAVDAQGQSGRARRSGGGAQQRGQAAEQPRRCRRRDRPRFPNGVTEAERHRKCPRRAAEARVRRAEKQPARCKRNRQARCARSQALFEEGTREAEPSARPRRQVARSGDGDRDEPRRRAPVRWNLRCGLPHLASLITNLPRLPGLTREARPSYGRNLH